MTTVSTSTSGTLSSVGIGSGLDVTSIISGLMKVENAPLTDLKTAAANIQTTISAFGSLQSAVSTFRDAASALALPSTWNATTGSSSDPTAVTVATTSNAAPGNYSVEVMALATAQSTVSGTFAPTDTVGAGTLHIDLGSWNSGNTAFTAKTDSAGVAQAGMDITVAATDTLQTLAGKVNSANAGVSASVVNDATGSRLVFTSSASGLDNTFRITATDGDGTNDIARLAYDPAGGSTATTLAQPAANSSAKINGVQVTSQSNTLGDVFNGITINLGKAAPGVNLQLTVAQDTTALTKSVQGFVDAYNALSTLLTTDLKYDAGTKDAGPLQGDSTARSLQTQLRGLIGSSSGASTTFSTLSQVGLQIQKDGTLSVDSAKLTSAMATPTELKKLFTNVDRTTPGNNGFANQLRGYADTVLGINGIVTTRTGGLKTKLGNNQKNQDSLSDRLAATEARLKAQYSALDKKMASITDLGNYVSQQITNWNKNTA